MSWTGARIRLKCSAFRIEHWPTLILIILIILIILTCVNTWSELIRVCEDCRSILPRAPHHADMCEMLISRCLRMFVPKAYRHVEIENVGRHVERVHKIFPSLRNSICKEAANSSDSVWLSQTQSDSVRLSDCFVPGPKDAIVRTASFILRVFACNWRRVNVSIKVKSAKAMYSLLIWKCSWLALLLKSVPPISSCRCLPLKLPTSPGSKGVRKREWHASVANEASIHANWYCDINYVYIYTYTYIITCAYIPYIALHYIGSYHNDTWSVATILLKWNSDTWSRTMGHGGK